MLGAIRSGFPRGQRVGPSCNPMIAAPDPPEMGGLEGRRTKLGVPARRVTPVWFAILARAVWRYRPVPSLSGPPTSPPRASGVSLLGSDLLHDSTAKPRCRAGRARP